MVVSSKGWTTWFIELPKKQRRFINNFMSSREGDPGVDYNNWIEDCRMYGFDDLKGKYLDCDTSFRDFKFLPED